MVQTVKNLPANSGVRSLLRKIPHAEQQLNHAPHLLKSMCLRACAPNRRRHCSEKPQNWNQRKPSCSNKDPVQPEIILKIKKKKETKFGSQVGPQIAILTCKNSAVNFSGGVKCEVISVISNSIWCFPEFDYLLQVTVLCKMDNVFTVQRKERSLCFTAFLFVCFTVASHLKPCHQNIIMFSSVRFSCLVMSDSL